MKIDRFNVVEVRRKKKKIKEVVNAYGQTVAKRNIIDEEIK